MIRSSAFMGYGIWDMGAKRRLRLAGRFFIFFSKIAGVHGKFPLSLNEVLNHLHLLLLDRGLVVFYAMGPFMKRHRLVHNGGFSKSEAPYCSPNMISSTAIS